jgi:hypothetical protein
MAKVEFGLSAQRIYRDLVGENGFTDSYQSVKRFVRKLREDQPERIRRLECQPGEELQLDFGLGVPIARRSLGRTGIAFSLLPGRPAQRASGQLRWKSRKPYECPPN